MPKSTLLHVSLCVKFTSQFQNAVIASLCAEPTSMTSEPASLKPYTLFCDTIAFVSCRDPNEDITAEPAEPTLLIIRAIHVAC
ncbi:9230_t:CDS:2 [Ambispora gerdemannii]|uniref:9230_t:CDS:1 n=1 Tax=Ambispora gerdemannii TaxID=144530 RepID=A0A9N9D560_9GLOM|nr:9230_t:CDS:2 [Ambispora gerdemannii]